MTSYERRYAASVCCANQTPRPRPRLKPAAERGHRKRGARPQKRGKRAGVHTRLTSKPARAALLSVLLSNVCSLENKLDCIRLQRTTRRESRDCCVFVFTETWLSDRVPDAAIQLDGLASSRQRLSPVRAPPHLGYSDHISVMLIPAYRPLVRRSKPVLKQVRTWPSGAISALQDCFENTDWQMFREAAAYSTTTDLEEYTSSVTSYISKCIDDVTVSKTITTRPNQKPWMTAEVRALLKARDSAFKAGDKAALRKARAKLSRGIREAKRAHGQSIHSHFRDSGDTRRMWQGIQAITNYRTAPPACDSDASLPDALNHFYARFETQNSVAARKTTPPPDDQVLCLTAADVRKTLRRVNPRKAAGLDNIPARVLRECADQLTDVFTDIFNISLSSATVPACLQHLPEQCHRPSVSSTSP
ncbi:hypothetical protein NFI96_022069 [Prochilodus magdalenae]|nr:hypothetical protein NFI96_022069 [Prochilodus magdalenae]